jgi:hypothetical protein
MGRKNKGNKIKKPDFFKKRAHLQNIHNSQGDGGDLSA